MNTQQPSPLVPQGVPLDPKNRGRARVKIAVFFVLAVHGIGLMALLMQGCRKEEAPAPQVEQQMPESDTNVMTAPTLDDTNLYPPVDTNVVQPSPDSALALPEGGAPVAPDANLAGQTPPPLGMTEYKVVKGDSFYTIGKKFNVSSKAIADANPAVNPTKLQIGQMLLIPPPTSTPSVAPAPGVSSGGGIVYEVKSGDNLTKIASKFGVTVKALRSENNLVTDRITVGQKLKIPSGGTQ